MLLSLAPRCTGVLGDEERLALAGEGVELALPVTGTGTSFTKYGSSRVSPPISSQICRQDTLIKPWFAISLAF